MIFRHLLNMRSHPTWVRGLKQRQVFVLDYLLLSHPTWVRGLKLKLLECNSHIVVAPYVGAWIETECACHGCHAAFRRTLRGCVD